MACARSTSAARYGGDEFVALLPETDPTGGWVLAEKIRLTVAEQGMPGVDPVPTVSVGRRLVPRGRPVRGRAPRERGPGDVRLEARRQEQVARATAEPMAISIAPHEAPAKREGERAG